MTKLSHLAILAALLLLALISYSLGFNEGAQAMLFIGFGFEGVFWILLASNRSKGSGPKSA